MDPQTIASIRILMMVGGTWLANHGYGNAKDLATITDPAVIEAFIGVASTLGGAVWALASRTKFGVLKTASHVLKDEGVIVAPKEIAEKLPGNVVSSLAEAAGKPGVPTS